MTFQKFLAFLIAPLSIVGCVLTICVATILWPIYLLCIGLSKVLWKCFEIDTFHLQGCINWLDDVIAYCYMISAMAIATVMQLYDEDLY